MKIRLLIITLFLTHFTFGQKVGVVLSGGGATGFAHIGVLKALEDYEIPIDYITGTSAGALIGGLYASSFFLSLLSPSLFFFILLSPLLLTR